MKIYQVTDPEFHAYGQIVTGMDEIVKNLTEALAKTRMPEEGCDYVPTDPILQGLSEAEVVADHCYGGMPIQLGWCNGHNRKLNCLEYHRDSEFNLGTEDFILLLAKQDQIHDFMLDTADVKAFYVPAGVLVEVYATTLHYAPCHVNADKGFKVMVALPWGTNTDRPGMPDRTREDAYLTARNKWLLAHAESSEAANGAVVGLKGENIDLDA
ncbi:MAG: DUF4867 family protein [Agathobacter sp.]|uniref:DUF4867 family protein n=1 Tax=Agathobacter sp. TaxID=2021311 RepID=UPI00258EC324|nr:DUF4867 family protein [Agathobacter sp.]MCR5677526.1 DUF4867 family protein [Agathobacter sp.]